MENDRSKFKNVEKKETTNTTNNTKPFSFLTFWGLG